jgi:HPt (histidine-containing phosphotransfer) domain-containing protein
MLAPAGPGAMQIAQAWRAASRRSRGVARTRIGRARTLATSFLARLACAPRWAGGAAFENAQALRDFARGSITCAAGRLVTVPAAGHAMTPPSYLMTFVHEVEDLLERIEAAILALETAPGDRELIHQLFRAFHTLKGSAGVAGVTPIAEFTHHVETAMDRVRSGAVALTPPLVSAVLASRDHVAALLATALGAPPTSPAVDLFSGTTIMGDGRVAMILDLAGTVRVGDRRSPHRGTKVLS